MQKSLLGNGIKRRANRKIDRRCVTKEELDHRVSASGYRRCMRCKKLRRLKSFYITCRKTLQRRTECSACANKRVQKWKRAHKHSTRIHRITYKHGLAKAEYLEMLRAQNSRCLICRKSMKKNQKRLAVDHDHKTGMVRGLLCLLCNWGLGSFRDNPKFLRAAAAYLER